MSAGAAHFVMGLALRCLPHDGRQWGQAMQAEFGEALRDGKPFGFALGCLVAGWRQLPFHADGRFALASHALALGLIVPATFHLGCALSGVKLLISGHDHYYAMLAAGGVRGRALADAYLAATPALTLLLFLLGSAHFFIAWAILDGRWHRAAVLWLAATVIAAAIVGIAIATAPGVGGIAIQFAASAIELAAIPLLAMWQNARAGAPHPMEA
jgi:hypothetical protein